MEYLERGHARSGHRLRPRQLRAIMLPPDIFCKSEGKIRLIIYESTRKLYAYLKDHCIGKETSTWDLGQGLKVLGIWMLLGKFHQTFLVIVIYVVRGFDFNGDAGISGGT